VLSVTLKAQVRTVLLSEEFNGSSMSSGWDIAGLGTSNWSVHSSNNASGIANELHLHYDPTFKWKLNNRNAGC
jgi:hypothetical protein